MSAPEDQPADTADTTPSKSLIERIPEKLFGGRVRTTTALLIVVFVGLLVLYGQRSDHYSKLDEQDAASSSSVPSPTPRPAETTPEYTEPIRTSVPSSTPSTTQTSDPTTPTTSSTDSGTGSQTSPPATTTQPGLQLPTIPGIVLPGQTPTTDRVR